MPKQPFVGEIMMWGGNFAMAGWSFCNGQLLPIAQNEVLYALIGTTYGGDGQSTFGLPNLQSRIPVHIGTGPALSTYVIGQTGGAEAVSLTAQTMPAHTHPLYATSSAANSLNITPTSLPANTTGPLNVSFYSVQGGDTTPGQLASTSVSPTGGSLPHENRMPTLCVSFVVALLGVFPSRN
jgi:microcystin-dependent protein